MPWYEDWFDADAYELVYDQRDLDEAERLADLIERAVQPAPRSDVLDVGTGRGRHARVFARRGYRVTGLDLSANAVATARARAEAEGLTPGQIVFVQGDMRLPHFQARFDGVLNLFTSFGYFDDDADHQRAVQAMADALKPGGWLVQDFLNAPHVRAHLVPQSEKRVDGVHVRQERWIADDHVHKRIMLTPGDGQDPLTYTEHVRLLTRDDFARMYAAAGLRLVQTWGDYDGGPHSAESPRLILHAEKSDTPSPIRTRLS
ncbi:MAG: methyltransferase domain-containing protein [Rubricoccaceae bacterium]|nr:methyltransferase domain-containing protein [Rubricoccaceae bacterium]